MFFNYTTFIIITKISRLIIIDQFVVFFPLLIISSRFEFALERIQKGA